MLMKSTENAIEKKIKKMLATLALTGPMLKGTLSKVNAKADAKHDGAHQLTWKGIENKTKILYVPASRLAEARKMILAYKKARLLLETLAELNADLYKIKPK